MGLGQRRVYLQGALSCGLGFRERLGRRHPRNLLKHNISIGKPHITERVPRIALDSLVKLRDRLLQPVGTSPVPVITPPQIESIRFRVTSFAPRHLLPLFTRESQPQLLSDLAGNRLFYRENIRDRTIIFFAPKLSARGGIDKIDLNIEPIAELPHSARQNRPYAQFAADLLGVDIFVLIAKCSVPCYHFQLLDLCKTVNKRLGYAVREIFEVWIAAHVLKRQHDNRIYLRRLRRKISIGKKSAEDYNCQSHGCQK